MPLIDRVRARIAAAIKLSKRSRRAVSLEVSDNPDLVRGVFRNDDVTLGTLELIAQGLGRPLVWFLAEEGELAAARGMATPTVPVLTTAAGALVAEGLDGIRIGSQLQRVARPPNPNLAEADLYAVFVVGTSMAPDHPAGALRFVQRGRIPNPGDDVVVHTRHWENDPGQAYIKRYVGLKRGHVILAQLDPADSSIAIPERYVVATDRVLSFNELFGI